MNIEPDKRGSGDSADALSFHIEHLGHAVPDHERKAEEGHGC